MLRWMIAACMVWLVSCQSVLVEVVCIAKVISFSAAILLLVLLGALAVMPFVFRLNAASLLLVSVGLRAERPDVIIFSACISASGKGGARPARMRL